jgi:hypothetical protein
MPCCEDTNYYSLGCNEGKCLEVMVQLPLLPSKTPAGSLINALLESEEKIIPDYV